MQLNDTLIEYKNSKTGQVLQTQVRRPSNIRNNQLGPYVMGDIVEICIKKNGQVTDTITYTVTNEVPRGKRIYGCASVDFVQMNWSQE